MRLGRLSRRAAASVAVLGLAISASIATPARAVPRPVTAPLLPPEPVVPVLADWGWQPVLDENFDSETLDESLWHTVHGTDWKGIVVPEAVDVEDGNLVMSVYTDADDDLNYGGSIATGYFGTHNPTWAGFDAAYGYAEARIKLPDGPGTYNAFWTETANNIDHPFDDPAGSGPEIDIMEHSTLGGDSAPADGVCDWPDHLEAQGIPCSETLLSGGHWNGFEEDHKVLHTTAVKNPVWDPTSPATRAATSLEGNYHTYGVLWTPDGYRYYVDGVETFRTPALGSTYIPENFILTGTVSNEPPWDQQDYGPLGAATNEKTFVDYVKVWQRPISEIPNQTAVANRPLTVPFTVTDYHYSSLTKGEPGSVRVTASSSDEGVVDDDNIVVTGNGPATPAGNFTNGGFETSPSGWTFPDLNGATSGTGNNATVWTTRKHAGSKALHLSEVNQTDGKGRAERTITGLQPNTTYQIGLRYDLELGFVDSNGNGRPDGYIDANNQWVGEPFTETGETETDGTASFDFGIVDVDASRAGQQNVTVRTNRNGWVEGAKPAWWHPPAWPEEMVQFTTGNNTTQVKLFVSNEAYASVVGPPAVVKQEDSDVTVDSLWMRAVVPAQRAVTLRPNSDAEGSTTITLTARDAAGNVINPTEQFTVDFRRGSTFTNGNFDAAPLESGWTLSPGDPKNGRGAQVVVDDPFRLNRVLQLAAPVTTPADGYPILPSALGVASQNVSGLTAGTQYTLALKGKGGFVFAVQEHTGPGSSTEKTVTSSDWTTDSIVFTPTGTTARIVMVDWGIDTVTSFIDDITLVASGTPGPVSFSAPGLAGLGELRIPSDSPSAIPFSQATTNGSTITVTSNNPQVLPAANVAATRVNGLDQKVLALTPLPGRTGKATLTVTYTDSTGAHAVPVTVVVSDRLLRNPGFEGESFLPWSTTANATSVAGRSGARALQIDSTTTATAGVTQIIGVPETTRTECQTRYTVTAWAKGNAKLTVRQPHVIDTVAPIDPPYTPAPLVTLTWANPANWTEQKVTFTTPGCFEHDAPDDADHGATTKSFEVLLEDTNTAGGAVAQFDDLSLIHAPAIRSIRDMSLHKGQVSWQWDTARDVSVGRVAANSFWDPAVLNVSSSNGLVLANADIDKRLTDQGWSFLWRLSLRAAATAKTGRSTVTMQLSDPVAGVTTETFDVTLNAGTSFNNGDFERDLGGWGNYWTGTERDRRARRPQGEWNPPASDGDNVLRLGFGVVAHQVKGLAPNTHYRLNLSAIGNGASVAVRTDTNPFAGQTLSYQGTPATTPITAPWSGGSPTWTPYNLTFTTLQDDPATPNVNELDNVWIVISDGAAAGAPVVSGERPCVIHEEGQSCYDDLGVFLLSDL